MSCPLYHYRAYGLRFCSDIDLSWPVVPGGCGSDVKVRFGAVPRTLEAPADAHGYWQTAPGAYLLNADGADGAARYIVSEQGRRIRVAPADDRDTHIGGLLGSVLAACLQMRGILTLHASAIETAAGAVLFAGHSGVGKSTLLAALVERGYAMLADDITGIILDEAGLPVALSAFPQTRLWADSLDALDESWRRSAGAKIRPGIEKYLVPVRRFQDRAIAVHAIYLMSTSNHPEVLVEPLTPARAVAGLVNDTYRYRHLRGLGQRGNHFRTMTAIAQHAVVARLVRPDTGCTPGSFATRVVECLPSPAR